MARKDDTKTELTEDDVIAFLKDNPRFFQDNPEILDVLQPPRQHTGKGVVDFQAYMVSRLRADRDEVIEATREIVETTRANMNSQARIHTAVLMLLEAHNFEDYIRTITIDLAALLNVDIVSLVVEADGSAVPHISLAGVRAVAEGQIDKILAGQSLLLESGIRGNDDIYGGGSSLVRSHALVRLNIDRHGPAAVLAFGSRDPSLFVPGQGTELVAFLGKVIERGFRSWLGLPQR